MSPEITAPSGQVVRGPVRGDANPSERGAASTVAGWLVVVEVGRMGGVREALAATPGIECRSDAHGTLVVVSESPAAALAEVQRQLRHVPGVRDAALVAAYETA